MPNVVSGRQRIAIFEDHRLVREAVRALLASDSNLEVVAEADNGCDAIRCVRATLPDLVLMDLSLPLMNGIEATIEIKTRYPKVKILVLTVHENEEYVRAAIRSGANGYVVKDASAEMFMEAVHQVLAGQTHLCSQAIDRMVELLINETKSSENASPMDSLTHRERQVLQLIAEGQTNRSTAGFLSISQKTVEKYRASLMEKLKVHSTAELTAFAMKTGIRVDELRNGERQLRSMIRTKIVAAFASPAAIDWCDLLSLSMCV